jgi:hypothetical protein
MEFDRLFGNRQDFADLPVCFTLFAPSKAFHFLWGKWLARWLVPSSITNIAVFQPILDGEPIY